MSAGSDVERELSRLKGEITSGAPKQLEGGANGSSQDAQAGPGQAAQAPGTPAAGTQYAPPSQQAQPASIPASDRPAEPQDGEPS